jgi:hypothetical protein
MKVFAAHVSGRFDDDDGLAGLIAVTAAAIPAPPAPRTTMSAS